MIVYVDIYFNHKVKLIELVKEVETMNQAVLDVENKIGPIVMSKIKACYESGYLDRFTYTLTGKTFDTSNNRISYNIEAVPFTYRSNTGKEVFHDLFFYNVRRILFNTFKDF